MHKIAQVFRFFIVLALVAAGGFAAQAKTVQVDGANDATFRDSIQQWLNGEDLVALTRLATMANDGNLAAQIFMGVVTNGVAPHTSSQLLLHMSQEQRRLLSRFTTGENAGKSWLEVAQDRHPLAKAYRDFDDNRLYQKAFDYLFAHGERFLASEAHTRYINQGGFRTALRGAEKGHYDSVSKPWLAAAVRNAAMLGLSKPSAKLREMFDGVEDAFSDTGREFHFWGRPYDAIFDPNTRKRIGYPDTILSDPALHNRLRGLVVYDPRMAPVRQLCDSICPNSASGCGIALRAHISSYDRFWNKSRSPIEAFISTKDYRKSARFTGDMRRLMASEPQTPSAVAPLSVCFSDYMYGK